jgi:integrase
MAGIRGRSGVRGNLEGSIFQRENGNWRAQVTVGGRRLSVTKNTKREAQQWLRQTLAEMDRGMTYAAAVTLYGDFLTAFLANKEERLRQSTFEQYRRVTEKYILPALGDVRFKDLKPNIIQRFYDELVKDGVGKRMIQITHSVVHSSLESAEVLNLVQRNPSKGLNVPSAKKRKTQVWTESEVTSFMIVVEGERNEHLYHLALTTGMRQGELLGLMWKDIDWLKGTISVVRQAFMPEGGGFTFVEPKTKNGKRTVELSPTGVDILRMQIGKVDELRAFAAERWSENDLVFPSVVGTPQSRWNLEKEFKKYIAAAGIPVIRFHDLRHTAASLMLNHGVEAFIVSRRLGHSTVQITMDLYGHILPGAQRDAARLMDDLVRPIRVDKEVE